MTFNRESTSEEVASKFASQISGKTVLITGTSWGGIGAETALVTAKYGAELVIITGRTDEALNLTITKITEQVPDANLLPLKFDLSSFKSVRQAANELNNNSNVKKIDVLFNNAGIMAPPYSKSVDGFEYQFAANYLGHFLFTNLIIDKIFASHNPKIINLTSWGHKFSPVIFEDPGFSNGEKYVPFHAYGQSKTANILFTKELNERYGKSKNLVVFSVHPGSVTTNLTKHIDVKEVLTVPPTDYQGNEVFTAEVLRKRFVKNTAQGAATSLVAAFDPSIENQSGSYMLDCIVDESACNEYAKDLKNASKLWQLGEESVGEKFPIKA